VLVGAPLRDVGRQGTTNGAAMRIAPVGIAVPATDLHTLVDRVVKASVLTHNTGVALAGAAAVAAAVSAGLDGATVPEVVEFAVAAARAAVRRGFWVDVAERIAWAAGLVRGLSPEHACDRVSLLVGTSLATQESAPATATDAPSLLEFLRSRGPDPEPCRCS